jgi:hypothetical protein
MLRGLDARSFTWGHTETVATMRLFASIFSWVACKSAKMSLTYAIVATYPLEGAT